MSRVVVHVPKVVEPVTAAPKKSTKKEAEADNG